MSPSAADEMVRFNEAIDQALAESIITFSDRTRKTRDIFLAILGHDLRAPLATMAAGGALPSHPNMTRDQAAEVGTPVSRGRTRRPRIPPAGSTSRNGDLRGSFDSVHLHQLFTNLLVNVAQYGGEETPVKVIARAEADAVVMEVTNQGPVIPEVSFRAIFEPLVTWSLTRGAACRRARVSAWGSLLRARSPTRTVGRSACCRKKGAGRRSR